MELINKYHVSPKRVWDIFIENATKENSELNAMGLTKLLNKYELNYRDYLWTIEINDLGEKDRIVSLAYFIEEGNKSSLGFAKNEASEETRRDENIRTRVMEAVKQTFRPEFLNRLDEILVFHPLKQEDVRRIADIQVRKLIDRMAKQGIQLEVDDSALEVLAEKGYDPAYGARPLKRTIQSMLQNAVADRILEDKPEETDILVVSGNDGKVEVKVEKELAV